MTQEQYDKVHQYLLDNGQQELAGHVDGLWQQLQTYEQNQDAAFGEKHSQKEGESAQDFQDRNKSTTTSDNPAPAAGSNDPAPRAQ